jgi:Bacterial membrane protein YfhO
MADRKKPSRDLRRPAPAPAFTLRLRWIAVVLALLTVFFFRDVTLGGKTFVSPDTGAPAGFVRMGEQALYHDHVYPLWNPFVFLGMPSFASGAYNPLIYPPDWPLGLLQKIVPLPDMTWMLVYYFLGALFFYLLACELGARPEGALLGAVAFTFAPNLVAVGSGGHGSQLVDSAYLPLMVWLTARWMRRGGLHHLAWLALAGGLQLLRGHVQICFYTWLAIGLYVLVEWAAALLRRDRIGPLTARAAAIGVAALLAFGLAGFYNLPLQEYARYSIRGAGEGGGTGREYATGWSLAPYELPSIVVPNWAGFGGDTYWGGMPFTDYPNAYLGIVAVALALPAFLTIGAPRVFALLLAALALMVAFGKHFPLYGFLYDHLPLFNKFRIPVMIVILFQLGAALGTAWGWSAILAGSAAKEPRGRRVEQLLLLFAGVLAVAFVVGVMGQGAWRDGYVRMAVAHKNEGQPLSANMYAEPAAAKAYAAFVSDLGRACLLGLLVVGVAWFARRRRLPALAATVLVLILLLFDLWAVSNKVMQRFIGNVEERNLESGRDDAIEFLEKAGPPGTFRVFVPEDFRSNRYAGFGIATLGGYHAAKTRLYQDFADKQLTENIGMLRLLNIRYIVLNQPFEMPPDFVREVHRGEHVIYENLMALPRATVVGQYVVVPPRPLVRDSLGAEIVSHPVLDSLGILSRTNEGLRLLGVRTYLEKEPHLTLGPVEGAVATITSYRLNDVTVQVRTPGAALLRLADLWYPDWTATVDGHATDVLKADYLLRAVAVPAGTHTIVFRYQSPSVWRGLMVSLASLALILAGFAVAWWRGRRPRGTGPVPASVQEAA